MHRRVGILGVPVDVVDMEQAVRQVDELIRTARSNAVIAINPEKIVAARKDPRMRTIIRDAGLLIPDGIGVVAAARLLGLGYLQRVPGVELLSFVCELAVQRRYNVFLFGASPDVNAKAAEVLRATYPRLQIVGRQHGYLAENKIIDLIAEINRSRVDILFIGLGSPKQEYWMEQHLPELDIGICQGVGGTFDVLAGKVRRAPATFRRLNLEWFYRLVTNPRRLTRQTALPHFAALVTISVVVRWFTRFTARA